MRVGAFSALAVALLAAPTSRAETPADRASPAGAAIRQALLIANTRYPDIGLDRKGGERAISALGPLLAEAKFEVDARQNLGREVLASAVKALATRLRPGAPILLYFNGLAISINGHVFLLPTDEKIASEADVRTQGVDLDAALLDLRQHGAGPEIIILEVPRENAVERRYRGKELGIGFFRAPRNTLILFDTEPADTTDDLSPFMDELLKELRTPGTDFEEALFRTRLGVVRATGGAEVPRFASSLAASLDVMPSEVEFVESPGSAPPNPPAAANSSDRPKAAEPGKAVEPPKPAEAPLGKAPEIDPASGAPAPAPPLSPPPPEPKTPVKIPSEAGGVFRDCADCPQLVVVPAGSFLMGAAPGEGPPHRVVLGRFFSLGRVEVTASEWARCVDEGACSRRLTGGPAEAPARVSWGEAQDFAAWLSRRTGKTYRLPSEAEWVYAANGGQSTLARVRPAGGVDAQNGFGLVGMGGDPAEWTQDCWNPRFWGAPHDGSAWVVGDCTQRVVRAGAGAPASRIPLRSADRGAVAGFRLLRELP